MALYRGLAVYVFLYQLPSQRICGRHFVLPDKHTFYLYTMTRATGLTSQHVKLGSARPGQALRVTGCWGTQNRHMKVARLSSLRTGSLYPPISARGCLSQWKTPVIPSGIESGTVQLSQRVPPNQYANPKHFLSPLCTSDPLLVPPGALKKLGISIFI